MTAIEAAAAMVASLLRDGETLDEIQRRLLPESWRRALRACAAAQTVTAGMYDSVLSRYAQPDAPPLADLERRGFIEPVAGDPAAWRMPDGEVARWMPEWHAGQPDAAVAPELVELEAVLARWHEQHGDRGEQLRHLLVADTPRAAKMFCQMFDEADHDRDFAYCQDLLDVLADPNRITLAGPMVAELRLDRAGYLRARLYWSVDYSRSAQYLVPPALPERTERLLSGPGPRVWQLYAPGGTGKTMQLQWLVARHCMTARPDIPCARIDFDAIDPVNVLRYPWLLLLEVADQLDRRWPRRVFERLDRFSSYRSLARRVTSELTRMASGGLASQDINVIEQQVTGIFLRRLNGAAGDRPVVLIVDTLEEITLGGAGDPDRLMSLLARLVTGCPALKLVLAGRYDLRRLAPEAMARLEPAESVEVTDFTREQVITYLSEIRGITGPALHKAVISRSHGQPFLVALLADIVEDSPGISPAELRQHREPALHLLIDRVIRRIPDPNVRWLVRYGVVPRRLRLEYVADVMRPFMARGRHGPSEMDDPRRDKHHLAGRDDIFPFGQTSLDDAELAAAWQRLLSYAARPSWVSPADDRQSVIFHPNVRGPMRELIADRPVFRALHDAFRRQFEVLAEQNPASRPAYLREAVYHRIQMGDQDAADFWRAEVIRFRDHGDLDGVEELAGELLRDDYLSNRLPRLRVTGRPLVPYEAVAAAHVFRAYAAAERAREVRAGPSDPLWSAVQRSLASAAFVRDHAPEPVSAAALEVAVQAALLVANSDAAQAIELATRSMPTAPADDQVDLLRVIGEAHAALGEPDAEPTLRQGLECARAQQRIDQQEAITLSLAAQAMAKGRLDKAVAWTSESPESATGTSFHATRARLLRAELLIECYQPAAALATLSALQSPDPARAAQIGRLRARANLLLGNETGALRDLDTAETAAGQMPGPASYAELAQIHQLRGVVLGELLALDRAENSFQLASSLWGEIGYSEGHPDCAYLYRGFLIRDAEDLAAASQVPRPAMEPDSEPALRWDEQTVELRVAKRGRWGKGSWSDSSPASGLPPHRRARLIVGCLARSWRAHRHLLPVLADVLRQVKPDSARLVVLDELRRCEQAVPEDVALLRRALPASARADHREDRELHRQLRAELDRLQGNDERAGRVLDDAIKRRPRVPETTLARWRWLQTRGRLRVPLEPRQVQPLLEARDDNPLLRAASLLVLIRSPGFPEPDRGLLHQAMVACQELGRPSGWAADLFRAAGEQTANPSLLAMADDMDRQLGRVRRRPTSAPAAQVLADREGEYPAVLPGPGRELADLGRLQRRLVEDWPALSRELGAALFDRAMRGDRALEKPKALRIESDDVMLQALPWELAVPSGDVAARLGDRWPAVAYRGMPETAARIDTRWLQRVLRSCGHNVTVDGVLGPATLDALSRQLPGIQPPIGPGDRGHLDEELADRARLRPTPRDQAPVALLLRPEAAVEKVAASHLDSGYDVADLYSGFGIRVRTLPSLLDAKPSTDHDPVVLLHITGRMDIRGTGSYFDFSPVEMSERLGSKARGTDVWPADIARWLRRCSPGREPLVVLDPPYPGSQFDVPWQLVLRNLFAATLFAEAAAPAIIATGVRKRGLDYVGPIATGARTRGVPLATVGKRLRSGRDDRRHGRPGDYLAKLAEAAWQSAADELAAQATAIFAAPSAYTLPDRAING